MNALVPNREKKNSPNNTVSKTSTSSVVAWATECFVDFDRDTLSLYVCVTYSETYICVYKYVDIYRYNVYNEIYIYISIYLSIYSVSRHFRLFPPSCGFDSSPPPVVFDSSPLSCGLSVEIRTAHASFPRLLQVTAQQFTSNADVNTWWPGETFFSESLAL